MAKVDLDAIGLSNQLFETIDVLRDRVGAHGELYQFELVLTFGCGCVVGSRDRVDVA